MIDNNNDINGLRLITNWQITVCLQSQYERMITSYYRSWI